MRYYRNYWHWLVCQARTFTTYTKKEKREYIFTCLKLDERFEADDVVLGPRPGDQLKLF